MKAVIQRVSSAKVEIGGEVFASIDAGLLILLGVEYGDSEKCADALASKIANLRIFTDENYKMNYSLLDVRGEALVISNFTLCADSRKGRRPSFTNAASPDSADNLYEYFVARLAREGAEKVATGKFGAEMKVSLTNEGPVTIILDTKDFMKE